MAYCKEAVSVLVGVDWNSISQLLKIFGGQEESVAHCCLVQDTQYCLVEYLREPVKYVLADFAR